MRTKRILWLSRHDILPTQRCWLETRFGEVEIVRDISPFENADDIIARYRSGQYDDLVVIAPLSVVELLCKKGLHPLWAEMIRLDNLPPAGRKTASVDLVYRGTQYHFLRFRRVRDVVMEFMDV